MKKTSVQQRLNEAVLNPNVKPEADIKTSKTDQPEDLDELDALLSGGEPTELDVDRPDQPDLEPEVATEPNKPKSNVPKMPKVEGPEGSLVSLAFHMRGWLPQTTETLARLSASTPNYPQVSAMFTEAGELLTRAYNNVLTHLSTIASTTQDKKLSSQISDILSPNQTEQL